MERVRLDRKVNDKENEENEEMKWEIGKGKGTRVVRRRAGKGRGKIGGRTEDMGRMVGGEGEELDG